MGSYTTNYKLFKPGSSDYVDVQGQLDNNLSLIDSFGHQTCEYRYFNVPYSALPMTGNRPGDKAYNQFDSSIAVWDGASWNQTFSKAPIFTDIALSAGFEPGANASVPGYDSDGDTCILRGRLIKTSLAIWTNGSATTVTANGAVPSPGVTMEMICPGAAYSTRLPQFYKLSVSTLGALTITRYGKAAQTAGDSSNFVNFEGLSYAVS